MDRKTLVFATLFFTISLPLVGCSSVQSDWTRFTANAVNAPAFVECYSGGKLIFKGESATKPISERDSDGYFFKDAQSRKFVEISGDCIFSYE